MTRAAPHAMAGAPLTEPPQRLSQSALWTLQRRFFEQEGVDAWRKGLVPHYITSNTYIARSYAQLVLSYLLDQGAARLGASSQPVYLVELGGGCGRFALHFLKKFEALFDASPLASLPYKYVITDISEKNIAFWRRHPALQTYFKRGLLDVALFDVAQPAPLQLQLSGVTLAPGTLGQPLVVLANYVFDSVGADVFQVRAAALEETLVQLDFQRGGEGVTGHHLLNEIDIRFEHRPAAAGYYADPAFNLVLESYPRLRQDACIVFPVVALACLSYLRQLSGDNLLMVSGDKGVSRVADLPAAGLPDLARHGSVSLMVNYHAIASYVQQQGGTFLSPPHSQPTLTVCAAIFGGAGPLPATQRTYLAHLVDAGPHEFYFQKQVMLDAIEQCSLEQILAFLRTSGWDSAVFLGCAGALALLAPTLGEAAKDALRTALDAVWDTYYHLDGDDLAFHAAHVLYELREYGDALDFLEHARRADGETPIILYNIAVCHYNLGQLQQAVHAVRAVLAREPAHGDASAMLDALRDLV